MSIPESVLDAINMHSVVVDGGSGVLIQPATTLHSYVLTAKHVIKKKDSASDQLILKEVEKILVTTIDGENVVVKDQFEHDELDAAILIVELQDNLKLSAYSETDIVPSNLKLRGFSGKRRTQVTSTIEWLESYDLELKNSISNKWIYRNLSQAPYEDVVGCSGGGVFFSETFESFDEVFIAGVEFEFEARREGQEHDHLCCVPIYVFNEIIQSNNLHRLKPVYLTDFAHLKDEMFPEKYYENHPHFKHQQFLPLINIVKLHCNRNLNDLSFTPEQLLTDHEHCFIVKNRHAYELEDRKCWFKFLELITMVSIVNDTQFSNLTAENLFNKFRVVYIRTSKPWEAHYEEVLTVNTSNLGRDGKIILLFNEAAVSEAVISKDIVEDCIIDISSARSDIESIDAVTAIKQKGFTLIHWPSLHNENIFKRSTEFQGLVEHLDKENYIKTIYNEHLNFLEVSNHE